MANNNAQVLAITITGGSVCSEIRVCFELKTEHENLHRNKAKNKVLDP
jgi:hypothetical protein